MKVYVDPWDPGYGVANATLDGPSTATTANVATDVELPAAAWQALPAPDGLACPAVLLFVDGVRRNDARVWVDDSDGTTQPGVAASYAAGVVRCEPGTGRPARLSVALVERGLFTSVADLAAVGIPPACYQPYQTTGGEPKLLDLAIGRQLAALETEAAVQGQREAAGTDCLLVTDGPLGERRHLTQAVGYIKTHQRSYLDRRLTEVVTGLPAGTRSPVFELGDAWRRYSWYLRLPLAPSGAPWAGVVRIECSAELAASAAIRLADVCTASLPRFASPAHKDPRAPQNLVPIAGLERRLRALLGDPRLLHRSLLRASR